MLKDFFYLYHPDRQIIITLLCLAMLAIGVIVLTDQTDTEEENAAMATGTADSIQMEGKQATATLTYQVPVRKTERFAFDPNTADSSQLLRLGLQPWQVRNIYKFRAAGGIYRCKEDFARLYGLTVKEYRELEPYIRISDDYLPAATLTAKQNTEKDTLSVLRKLAEGETIELNTSDTTILKRVPGIGSYYARKIADYRKRLGGFVSIDQLDEIDNFPMKSKSFFVITATDIQKININKLSLNELRQHPYLNYYQARAIVDYRRQNGKINSIEELGLLQDFPKNIRNKLIPYIEY
jgi:DNA uptake protein ComE-like DNA-binding protein